MARLKTAIKVKELPTEKFLGRWVCLRKRTSELDRHPVKITKVVPLLADMGGNEARGRIL